LKNVFIALRSGGLLKFNFAADGNCSHLFKVVRRAIEQEEFSYYFKDFIWPWYMPSVDEYTNLINSIKFQELRVWGENADRFFPNTEALIGWIDQPSLVPFLVCVPETYKAAFRDYVVEEMIQETKRDDGRCFETFRRINLFARK
jgi:trans-aconitate methyltransferase